MFIIKCVWCVSARQSKYWYFRANNKQHTKCKCIYKRRHIVNFLAVHSPSKCDDTLSFGFYAIFTRLVNVRLLLMLLFVWKLNTKFIFEKMVFRKHLNQVKLCAHCAIAIDGRILRDILCVRILIDFWPV